MFRHAYAIFSLIEWQVICDTSYILHNTIIHENITIIIHENNTRYFKLLFIGRYSRIAELKLRQLLKRFCEADLNIKLVFTSFKIKNMFSFKDGTPDALKSMVVYQFICAGCNSCYIGETSRHFSTRI